MTLGVYSSTNFLDSLYNHHTSHHRCSPAWLKCPLPILSPKEALQSKEDKEEFFNFFDFETYPQLQPKQFCQESSAFGWSWSDPFSSWTYRVRYWWSVIHTKVDNRFQWCTLAIKYNCFLRPSFLSKPTEHKTDKLSRFVVTLNLWVLTKPDYSMDLMMWLCLFLKKN